MGTVLLECFVSVKHKQILPVLSLWLQNLYMYLYWYDTERKETAISGFVPLY